MGIGARPRLIAAAVALAVVAPAVRAPAHADGPLTPRARPWASHVERVDRALADGDLGAAVRGWQEAYIAALGSWRWEGPIEVGDAYLRIGRVSGLRQASAAKARNLYLTALVRARQQSSLDGALRAGEAFARLGDREAAAQCLALAERLAAAEKDPTVAARVNAFRARLVDAALVTGEVGP